MEEAVHSPTKLDRVSQKVAQLLSQKYKLADSSELLLQEQRGQRGKYAQGAFSPQDVQAAIDRSEQMNSKLKFIRTILGYDSPQKPRAPRGGDKQAHSPERTLNLKQFVLSMRKKSEVGEKYVRRRRLNSIGSYQTFAAQAADLQQYTDIGLKYIHSFLPHHNTLEHPEPKLKFSSYTPQHQKRDSPEYQKYSSTISNAPSETEQFVTLSKQQSHTISQQHQNKTYQLIQSTSKTPFNLPHLHPTGSVEANYREICASRASELAYKARQTREVRGAMRNSPSAKGEGPERKELFPTIKACFPGRKGRSGGIPP